MAKERESHLEKRYHIINNFEEQMYLLLNFKYYSYAMIVEFE